MTHHSAPRGGGGDPALKSLILMDQWMVCRKGMVSGSRGFAVYEEHILDQGDQYKGMLVGDVKHGLGAYIFTNGDMYEGEFRNDDMCGYGSYTFSSDGRYEGQVCIIEPPCAPRLVAGFPVTVMSS